jgi:predicted HAD superfamily Cof-like phosphohydrolase
MSYSDAMKVKEFTEQSSGISCPVHPKAMSRDDVKFIIRMVMSELCELASTVSIDSDDRDQLMILALEQRDRCTKNFSPSLKSETHRIAEQADAMVDSWYYMCNIAAKHGVNLSSVFNVVHEANMAKKDPETGKFIRRESDGKILKPEGWQAPDINAEIQRQTQEGSWNHN